MHINRRFTTLVLAAACLAASTGLRAAEEHGSKDEAKAMVDAAYDYMKKVGPEKAYEAFTHDKTAWTKKDLYVMVFTGKGVTLAHGGNERLVGKDLSGLKDGKGELILPGLFGVASKGGGWYDYDWPNPLTKKLAPKSTYARTPPTGDGFIGVGIYR